MHNRVQNKEEEELLDIVPRTDVEKKLQQALRLRREEARYKEGVIDGLVTTTILSVPCGNRHFEQSGKKSCPFGKECFFKHLNKDGSVHVFTQGVRSSVCGVILVLCVRRLTAI